MKRALLAVLLLAASCGSEDNGPTDEDFARAAVSRCEVEYTCQPLSVRERLTSYPCISYEDTLKYMREDHSSEGVVKATPEQLLAGYERARCLVDLITTDGCAKAMPAGIYSDELKAACCNGDCTKN